MTKFDVLAIGDAYFLLVQSEHLLELPSTILVPVLPRGDDPGLRGLTVDISIEGRPYRIAAHMPVTVETRRLQQAKSVQRLSPEDGQRVMDGLYAVLWGL
jgi:hypothetical protein